jgi:carboxypeptidase D
LQVGFDLPAVTSDMITRFMGVDYGALPGHQATSPSKVGDEDRVVVGLGKEEGKGGMALLKGGKTDWEGE